MKKACCTLPPSLKSNSPQNANQEVDVRFSSCDTVIGEHQGRCGEAVSTPFRWNDKLCQIGKLAPSASVSDVSEGKIVEISEDHDLQRGQPIIAWTSTGSLGRFDEHVYQSKKKSVPFDPRVDAPQNLICSDNVFQQSFRVEESASRAELEGGQQGAFFDTEIQLLISYNKPNFLEVLKITWTLRTRLSLINFHNSLYQNKE